MVIKQDIFGQLPDVLEDAWINVAIGEKEKAKRIIDSAPEKHPFEIKYNEQARASDWETCTKILNKQSKLDELKKSW
ncbi:hypothetical protein [Selenihalanaerobacter shriftii]|uniref:hypothetical protein n=1 Tax=Selenihalanaerobacter shriftii TaxID=142842 RepID=UPI00190EE4DE|nr:hypothetical protein [Selenihalanaerobacter shriftii]